MDEGESEPVGGTQICVVVDQPRELNAARASVAFEAARSNKRGARLESIRIRDKFVRADIICVLSS